MDRVESMQLSVDEVMALRKQLAESQAREQKMRDAMNLAIYQHAGKGDSRMNHWTAVFYNVLNAPSDSTALDSAIRQAKREALLEAAVKVSDYHGKHFVDNALNCGDVLRKMADEIKD